MSPGYEGETGEMCPQKFTSRVFYPPREVIFFSSNSSQHIREGNVFILKNYTKKIDITAGKKGANTAGDARIYLSTRDSRAC